MSKKKSPRRRAWNPAIGAQTMRRVLMVTQVAQCREPLTPDEISELSRSGWQAVAAIRSGTATGEHTADLCVIAEICTELCSKGLGTEYAQQCAAASAVTEAIKSTKDGQLTLTEGQLAALEELLTVHDAMLQSGIYAGEYIQIIDALHRKCVA